MKTLKTIYCGFPVEVMLESLAGCNTSDYSIPNSIVDMFCEKIDEGERSGTFSDMPDDEMQFGRGPGHTRSGSWRVIELDYEKISRILAWEYNYAPDEQLSEELFIRYYGKCMGQHYYEKWLYYKCKLHDMMAYFNFNTTEGQLFCDMIMEQMNKFEKRKRGETTANT